MTAIGFRLLFHEARKCRKHFREYNRQIHLNMGFPDQKEIERMHGSRFRNYHRESGHWGMATDNFPDLMKTSTRFHWNSWSTISYQGPYNEITKHSISILVQWGAGWDLPSCLKNSPSTSNNELLLIFAINKVKKISSELTGSSCQEPSGNYISINSKKSFQNKRKHFVRTQVRNQAGTKWYYRLVTKPIPLTMWPRATNTYY